MSSTAFDDFLQSLAVPPSCVLNKAVYKKMFLDASDGKKSLLDATDKTCLKDDISKIRWLYTLKPSTINIATRWNARRSATFRGPIRSARLFS